MNPVFLAWLVQGQPRRRRRKTGIKVQDYINKGTDIAISQRQTQDGAGGI
jgi:hypothetical protein